MDLILGTFARDHLHDFSEKDLETYDALLQCQDPDVYDWIVGRCDPPVTLLGRVMTRLRSHRVAGDSREE